VAQRFENESFDPVYVPFYVIHRLGHTVVNLCTKFEIPNGIKYEDMIGDEKCKN